MSTGGCHKTAFPCIYGSSAINATDCRPCDWHSDWADWACWIWRPAGATFFGLDRELSAALTPGEIEKVDNDKASAAAITNLNPVIRIILALRDASLSV